MALELGAVDILICWENLDIVRYVLKVPGAESSQPRILHLTSEQEKDKSHFTDKDVSSRIPMRICTSHESGDKLFSYLYVQSGAEMELMESQPLIEWLADNYKTFGATLEIITDKSQEGSQFVRGFGGIGGKIIV